jgi:L-rhamnonate dehydratase
MPSGGGIHAINRVHVVAKLTMGRDICEVEALYRHVVRARYYHHKRAAILAIAALETAMWDAFARVTGQPLHALWGGAFRATIPAAYAFTRDPDALADRLAAFRAGGFQTFKVKIGFDAASDIALARKAREVVGTADLRRCQAVPLALDESAYTTQDVSNIVQAEAADAVLLDPHQAGGLWQTIKAAAICEARGIPVTLHSGAELAISHAAYVHLGLAIPNLTLAIDTERSYLAADIAPDAPVLERGRFLAPTRPGLGATRDRHAIAAYKVHEIAGAYLYPARPGWFPVKPAF